MMVASTREERFWNSIASSMVGPEWMRNLSEAEEQGGSETVPSSDINLYVVDLKSGLSLAGGFSESGVEAIVRGVAGDGELKASIGTHALAGTRRLADDEAHMAVETKMALLNAIGALGSTKLIAEVKRKRGSLKGSFVYMIYSTGKGQPIARWVFMGQSREAHLNLLELYGVVAGAVRQDTCNSTSAVGSRIKTSGGLQLCQPIDMAVRALGGAT